MEVDELVHDDYIPVSNLVFYSFILSHCFHKPAAPSQQFHKTRKAAGKAAESRKRRGSTSLHRPGTQKRQASSSRQQLISAEEVPDDAFEVSNYLFSLFTVNQTG